ELESAAQALFGWRLENEADRARVARRRRAEFPVAPVAAADAAVVWERRVQRLAGAVAGAGEDAREHAFLRRRQATAVTCLGNAGRHVAIQVESGLAGLHVADDAVGQAIERVTACDHAVG